MKNELLDFQKFCEKNEKMLGVKSVIWQRLAQDFGSKTKNVRGYGVNNEYSDNRTFLFIKLNSIFLIVLEYLHFVVFWISIFAKAFVARILSVLIFQSITAVKKYSFKDYVLFDYKSYEKETGYLADFKNRDSKNKYNISFSHHTFKLFCYMKEFQKECSDFSFEGKNVLEVGGGMLNFAVLCNEHVDRLFYVVVDLPEVIEAAYLNTKAITDDVEVFLPHQIDEAMKSTASKKLLAVLPGQIDHLDLQFDLFVNHESFAEMDRETVHKYLTSVAKLMRPKGLVFLVNRFFRVQTSGNSALRHVKTIDQVTSFDEYKPTWCEDKVYRVETFRQHIRTQSDRPNAFYIGVVK